MTAKFDNVSQIIEQLIQKYLDSPITLKQLLKMGLGAAVAIAIYITIKKILKSRKKRKEKLEQTKLPQEDSKKDSGINLDLEEKSNNEKKDI